MNLKPKMIQDEMGEAFENEYGRMSGFLGVETPNAQAGLQNMILYGFVMPPTEVLDGIELPPGMEATPIAQADDGTQIWKFTHNGVDTHPIHFHLYDVQLLNRVGWDGIIRKPEATELGWKDTVRDQPARGHDRRDEADHPADPGCLGRPAQQRPPARPVYAGGCVHRQHDAAGGDGSPAHGLQPRR